MSRAPARGVPSLALLLGALSLSAVTRVRAEDDLVDHAKKLEETKQSLGNRVDAVATAASQRKERMLEAASEAKARAAEKAAEVKERSREAADSLTERAHEAAESAKAYAEQLKEQLAGRAKKLSEDAAGVVSGTKDAFRSAIQNARDEARKVLIDAAGALDNRTRDARNQQRAAHWQRLRERYRLEDQAPSLEVSEELRDHEYRLARLQRARSLAADRQDTRGVARADRLLEAEYGRHRKRLKQLLEIQRRDRARIAGEPLDAQEEGRE